MAGNETNNAMTHTGQPDAAIQSATNLLTAIIQTISTISSITEPPPKPDRNANRIKAPAKKPPIKRVPYKTPDPEMAAIRKRHRQVSYWAQQVRTALTDAAVKPQLASIFQTLSAEQIQTIIETYFVRNDRDSDHLGPIDDDMQNKLYSLLHFTNFDKYPNAVTRDEIKAARVQQAEDRRARQLQARQSRPSAAPPLHSAEDNDTLADSLAKPSVNANGLLLAAGGLGAADYVPFYFHRPPKKRLVQLSSHIPDDPRLNEILAECGKFKPIMGERQVFVSSERGAKVGEQTLPNGNKIGIFENIVQYKNVPTISTTVEQQVRAYIGSAEIKKELLAIRARMGEVAFRKQIQAQDKQKLVWPAVYATLPWPLDKLSDALVIATRPIQSIFLPAKGDRGRAAQELRILQVMQNNIDASIKSGLLQYGTTHDLFAQLHGTLSTHYGNMKANLIIHILRIALYGKSKKMLRRERRQTQPKSPQITAKPAKPKAEKTAAATETPQNPRPIPAPPITTIAPARRVRPALTADSARELLIMHKHSFDALVTRNPEIAELAGAVVESCKAVAAAPNDADKTAAENSRGEILREFQMACANFGVMSVKRWREIQSTGVTLESIGAAPESPFHLAFWIKHWSENVPNPYGLCHGDLNDIRQQPKQRRFKKNHPRSEDDFWGDPSEYVDARGPGGDSQDHRYIKDRTPKGTGTDIDRLIARLDAKPSPVKPKPIGAGTIARSALNRVKASREDGIRRALIPVVAEPPKDGFDAAGFKKEEQHPDDKAMEDMKRRLLAAHAAKIAENQRQ